MSETVMYALLFVSLYFEVFLLVSYLQRRMWRSAPLPLPANAPTVAIVVPCFNEEKTVTATMRSLLALEYPKDKLEIIVVDDGSTDRTLDVVQGFTADARVRLFRKENGGKHTAMNFALAQTSAEFIGCLDADSVVAPQALLNIVAVFQNGAVSAVTPGIHVKDPKTLLQHMQNVEYRLSVFNRFMFAALGSAFITPGPFSVFRTSVVRELGGWREGHSTEDMEMALRMQAAGHLIANAPRAVVHTSTPPTVRRLFRQRVRWTYGFLRNAVDYRHMLGNRNYGNLGIIVLPAALISIGTGIFFFGRLVLGSVSAMYDGIVRIYFSGMFPSFSFELFYINTSAVWFLVYIAVALILVLISAGSLIGTGSRKPPAATPLFLLLYSFLVPLWLGTALVRAMLKTGVNWR